jgi:hypothetical protein
MNLSDIQSFENAAKATRQEMLRLTPGERILRTLGLHELGMRLKRATAEAQKKSNASWQVAEKYGSDTWAEAEKKTLKQIDAVQRAENAKANQRQ